MVHLSEVEDDLQTEILGPEQFTGFHIEMSGTRISLPPGRISFPDIRKTVLHDCL